MHTTVRQAQAFRERLVTIGWKDTPSRDLTPPDGYRNVTSTTTFTTGEITLTAVLREYPKRMCHIRVTAPLAQRVENLGVRLAEELDEFGSVEGATWPPPFWTELGQPQ